MADVEEEMNRTELWLSVNDVVRVAGGTVLVVEISEGRVRLGLKYPRHVPVDRSEVEVQKRPQRAARRYVRGR